MSERFHVNCPLSPGQVSITGPEAHHMSSVCRVRPGDLVCLFNGDGKEYHARVTEVSRRDVLLDIETTATPQRELPFQLAIASPLPKGDRAQFLIEKLTELGVTDFYPLLTTRTVVQAKDDRREKLQRYVIEASKQCGRNVLMNIHSPVKWGDFLRAEGIPSRKVVAHPGAIHPSEILQEQGDVVAAIGPEGGLTDEEVDQATQAGWEGIRLGDRILRVETAGLVLATMLGLGRTSTH